LIKENDKKVHKIDGQINKYMMDSVSRRKSSVAKKDDFDSKSNRSSFRDHIKIDSERKKEIQDKIKGELKNKFQSISRKD
jgi:hypothetical protein